VKFVIRRAVVGVLAIPMVASAYFIIYSVLVGLGSQPTQTPSEVAITGLWIGGVCAVLFACMTRKVVATLFGSQK
jgi:dienelactone hydrolase